MLSCGKKYRNEWFLSLNLCYCEKRAPGLSEMCIYQPVAERTEATAKFLSQFIHSHDENFLKSQVNVKNLSI